MSKKNTLSPKDKLIKAVFGTTKPSPEQIAEAEARMYEREAASVTDEEFEKMAGCPKKEFLDKSMLFVGWCEAVCKWKMKHGDERKYHVFDDEPVFTTKQVIDMAQMFYRQGQDDGKAGIAEYNRLWKLNKLDVYVTDEKVTTPKFKAGDELHHKDHPEESISILSVDNDYYVDTDWAGIPQHLPFEYVEKNYELWRTYHR